MCCTAILSVSDGAKGKEATVDNTETTGRATGGELAPMVWPGSDDPFFLRQLMISDGKFDSLDGLVHSNLVH